MNQKEREASRDGIDRVISKASKAGTLPNNAQRRRALIAGLAALPVVLTLKSRSAFAVAPRDCSVVVSIALGTSPGEHGSDTLTTAEQNTCKDELQGI